MRVFRILCKSERIIPHFMRTLIRKQFGKFGYNFNNAKTYALNACYKHVFAGGEENNIVIYYIVRLSIRI